MSTSHRNSWRIAVALPFLITLATAGLACEQTGWNWDVEWWKKPDRRVGPTSQPVEQSRGAMTENTRRRREFVVSRQFDRPSPVLRPIETR